MTLVFLVRKRRGQIPFSWMFVMFGVFIVSCGFTHFMEVVTYYNPLYRLSGAVKVWTALASWATVVALVPVLPRALALRTPEELEREVARRTEELQRLNEALEVEVAERQRASRRERQANAELRELNEEMEMFVYTVSHDLKTPVVTIQSFVGMMLEDLAEGRTEDVQDSAVRIRRAADRMTGLIGDLLQLSRIGRLRNEPVEVDMTALAGEVAADFEEHLRQAGAALDIRPDMPRVVADRARLVDLFENLLSNAVKYGCDALQPRVEVGGCVADDEIRYFVSDNGQGIEPRFHTKVFGLFERLDTRKEGTGVGLAIVARIMQVHGGRTWIESSPGKGAAFWVAFPAHPRDDRT